MKIATICFLCLFFSVFVSAQTDQLIEINKTVETIDDIKQILNKNFLIFCKLDSNKTVVQVTDTTNWPETDIEATYNVMLDSLGNIVKFIEIPTSESGDWGLMVSYYFDENGRMRKSEYSLGSFSSECTKILRDKREQWYSATGEVISNSRSVSDGDNNPLDTTGCYIHTFEYPIYESTKAVKKLIPLS